MAILFATAILVKIVSAMGIKFLHSATQTNSYEMTPKVRSNRQTTNTFRNALRLFVR